MRRFQSTIVCTLFAFLGVLGSARAQYQYPSVPPPAYNPYYPWGRQSALSGAADLVNAQGNVYVQQEQARIQREQANQAKIDTKRRAFDEAAYEKANTPAFTEQQEKVDAMVLRRVMNSASPWDITSGYALNKIVPYVNGLAAQGVMGPAVPVDAEQLQYVNVRVGNDIQNTVGPLRNGGRLDWPPVLQGPLQKKLDGVLPQAVSQATMGSLDAKLYREVKDDLGKVRDDLSNRFRTEKIDGGDYLTGRRFLEGVDNAVQTLGKPGTSKMLGGAYRPKGRSVPEVAYSMTSQGLQFAPATAGEEAPYYALHSAFVSYARAAQAGGGFQVTNIAPAPLRKGLVDPSKGGN